MTETQTCLGKRHMKTLAIIPAKGRSVSVPRKNLAPVCGKPLIWYTLDCAKRAKRIDRLIVSTEDDEIAAVAEAEGVCVERRPERLCQDDTPTLDVLRWHLGQQDEPYAFVLCLQPTCPLRRPEDIDGAIELLESSGAESVVSYVDVGPNHPARMATIRDGKVYPLGGARQWVRRQDLSDERTWLRSGDIYLTRASVLGESLTGNHCRAWIIEPDRHCNVDGPLDLVWARKRISMLTGAST